MKHIIKYVDIIKMTVSIICLLIIYNKEKKEVKNNIPVLYTVKA